MNEEEERSYSYNFSIDDIHILYVCVCKRLESWAGGHPSEQERLYQLKNELYKGVLDFKFNNL